MATRTPQVHLEAQMVGDLIQVSIKSEGVIREWTFTSRENTVESRGQVAKAQVIGELLSYTETQVKD